MSNKRIGTITVHNGYNYGASLQAFATVHFLRINGYSASLIDYRNPTIEGKNTVLKPKSLKKIVVALFNSGAKKRRMRRFDSFNNLAVADGKKALAAKDLPSLNEQYDCFVCGSDQIWNPDITGFDASFFLNFAEESKKRIAYAPSIGHFGNYSEEVENFIKDNISTIDVLSVREKENKEFVERLSSKSCQVVLDPVFLLSADNWAELINKSEIKTKNKKYAIYYSLFEDNEFFEYAKADAKRKGLKLFRMNMHWLVALKKKCGAFNGVGPIEFVSLFKNAQHVYTNSFHGTAFAIIFNKPFVTALLKGKQSGKNSRIHTLLGSTQLEDRIYEENKTYDENIDWDKVNGILNSKAEASRRYLIEAINE